MLNSPIQALQAGLRPDVSQTSIARKPHLLIAGGAGVVGRAVTERLVGAQRFAHTLLLAQSPLQPGLRAVSAHVIQGDVKAWPPLPQACDVAVLIFGQTGSAPVQPGLSQARERALWMPTLTQLPELAAWLHQSGVKTLLLCMPHEPGSLPNALKAGLANLEEQAVASLGFERLIVMRASQSAAPFSPGHLLKSLAQSMLGIFKYMVPEQERPVRAQRLAVLIDALLAASPAGVHVIAPQLLSQWAALEDSALDSAISSYCQGVSP